MRRLIPLLLILLPVPSWACDHAVRLYNTATTIDFCLWETDGTDLMTSATITAGEVKVSQSEGAEANCTNGTGACVTDRGSCYSIALDQAETDTARAYITIIDTAAKTFLDHCIIVDFYGNSSAQYDVPDVNVSKWNGTAVATPATAGYPACTIKDGTGTGEIDTNAGAVVSTTTAATCSALGATAKSDVNAEVLDVLNTDTFGELTSPPAATVTPIAMLRWIYMVTRNKLIQNASTNEQELYRDDGSTKVAEAPYVKGATSTTRDKFGTVD